MGRTKQTPCGGSSHHPKGMATATFTRGADDKPEEQPWDTLGENTEDSQEWPKYGDEATQEEGEVQVSLRVRKIIQPSRPKEEQMPLPRKFHQHLNPLPKTQNQVPAQIPSMPQPRLPPRTPPSQPSKTLMKTTHQTLLTMSKLTNRQVKYG